MPGVEEGFIKAVIGTISGLIMSVVVDALSQSLNGLGNILILLFSLISIIGVLEIVFNMNFWSLTYIIGWFAGLILIGRYFIGPWEFIMYVAVSITYILLKMARKFED
jgi:hypothetical protein